MAISARADLPEAVTDVIVDRGEGQGDPQARQQRQRQVLRGRLFRHGCPRRRRRRTGRDCSACGIDLPVKFLRDLLRRAKEAVRDRLLAIAPRTRSRTQISQVLNDIARDEAPAPPARDFSVAEGAGQAAE